MSFKCICINDKNFPNEVPISKYPKKGEEYTVIEVVKCNVQGGLLGYKLAEIDLSGYMPYIYFAANRFAISTPEEILEEVEELAI